MNQLSVYELVNNNESLFGNVNDQEVVSWQKESQFAIQSLQNNTYTQQIAYKNPASLQNAIINVASIGISLNPANKHAYLVPRDGRICLDVSYMGLMHLAVRSGSIKWGQAKLVYENDMYENNGIDKAPTHKQKTFGDKGGIVGAYCTVKLPDGDYLTEEMDIDALNKIKATSKAAKGPWKTFPEEMMRKTVVKRASKYWPNCEDVNKAVEVLNEHEGLGEAYQPELKEVGESNMFIDDSHIEQLEILIKSSGADRAAFLDWLGVKEIYDVTVEMYPRAINALNQKAG
ncbi:MAG: recombinase RecT [Candidatus Brocadiaceae bacterium]|nr:recombinase RecT [Candidatus Brocadiaceae bacterium]